MAPAKSRKGDASAKLGASLHRQKMERCKRMIEELYRDTGVPRSTVRGSLVRIREFIDEAIEGIDQEV